MENLRQEDAKEYMDEMLPPKEKVEGFKLTKEQLEWMKIFKEVNHIERALGEKLRLQFGELQRLQQMRDEAAGKKVELLKMAPVKGTKELSGQEGR